MTRPISARFATNANTTWLSAMIFLDLVKIEVNYRRHAHDVSARHLGAIGGMSDVVRFAVILGEWRR
jgi:hypothetical protein